MSPFFKRKLFEAVDQILEGPMCLDKAILLSVVAHAGQKDKGNNSYIRHPLRVMEQMDSEYEMCVAVVHDVVEDSEFSLVDLRALSFTQDQIDAVDALTKREGEEYLAAIRDRVCPSVVASKVKEKDIRDNMALWRLKNRKLTEKDMTRMQNYIDALELLGTLRKK
jgi:GTP diphosphokinase / guanosine-3',5'-bis(diphosphate) 3'-diphosphatase